MADEQENITITVQMYLRGIDYPARKKEILNHARSQGAPDEVMLYLNSLPDRAFRYPTDVAEEFLKMK